MKDRDLQRSESPLAKSSYEIFLTEQQLADRHRRSVKTLRNLRVKGGYIRFVKIGRHVRYRLSDVLEFERQHTVGSTSELKGAAAIDPNAR